MSIWDCISRGWRLFRRLRSIGNPVQSVRLTLALLGPRRILWTRPPLLAHLGITVDKYSERIVVVRLPGGIELFVPSMSVSRNEIIRPENRRTGEEERLSLTWASSGEPAYFQLLRLFLEVCYADQYDACSTLGPGATVVDVGANAGCFTLLASKLVGDSGRVVAVEPVPDFRECLELMCESNKLGNVTIVPEAVGENEGTLTLGISWRIGAHSAKFRDTTRTVTVPMTSVDAVVKRIGLERVDFIKMDIEGMEADALRGAAHTIEDHIPFLSVSAYHFQEDERTLPEIIRSICSDYEISIRQLTPDLEKICYARPSVASHRYA